MNPRAAWATWSLRRRLVVSTTLVTTSAMVVLTVLMQIAMSQFISAQVDQTLSDRADAVIATMQLDAANQLKEIETPDSSLDVGIWVFDARGNLVEGTAKGATTGTGPARLSMVGQETRSGTAGSRLLARPFEIEGARAGVAVVSEPLDPYATTQRYALFASLILGALVVIVVAAIAAWIVSRSLRPVAMMASRAADWSEHDLTRRFDLGPPRNELTSLAAVLDDLLEQVARVITSEQRLTAELAHELRTPLAAIRGEAELAVGDITPDSAAYPRLLRIQSSIDRLSETISTLMDAARTALPTTDAVTVSVMVEDAIRAVHAEERQIRVVSLDGLPALAVPQKFAVRCLVPVLDNALRYAHSAVVISGRVAGRNVLISVADDGAGWGCGDPEDAFSAGTRDPSSPGAGLGLPLARRLASAAGGDVFADTCELGAVVVIRLPCVVHTHLPSVQVT